MGVWATTPTKATTPSDGTNIGAPAVTARSIPRWPAPYRCAGASNPLRITGFCGAAPVGQRQGPAALTGAGKTTPASESASSREIEAANRHVLGIAKPLPPQIREAAWITAAVDKTRCG